MKSEKINACRRSSQFTIVISIIVLILIYFFGNLEFLNFEINSLRLDLIFTIILTIGVIVYGLTYLVEVIKNSRISKERKNNFEKRLSDYLEKKNDWKQAFLVEGDWGSGKTYITQNFFSKYYKYSQRKIYNISCFGLDTREKIENEIIKQIDQNSNRLFDWIKFVPGFGKVLNNLLIDTFSLKDLPNNAILIFDDFERISPTLNNDIEDLYNKSSRVYNRMKIKDTFMDEETVENIDKEFKEIEKGFKNINVNVNEILELHTYQKYNVVTGLINDLVERKKLHVIIICNTDRLGKKFFNDIFKDKLDCITYLHAPTTKEFSEIFREIKNSYVIEDNLEKLMEENFSELVEYYKLMNDKFSNNNLRHTRLFIIAFIETVNYFNSSQHIHKKTLLSILVSIYTTMYLEKTDQIKSLTKFKKGGFIPFYLDYYLYHDDFHLVFENIKDSSALAWIGTANATFWILNNEQPEIDNSESSFNFYNIEKELYTRNYKKIESEPVLINHLFYVSKNLNKKLNEDKEEINWDKACSNINFSYYENLMGQIGDEEKALYYIKIITMEVSYFNSDLHKRLFSTIKEVYNIDSLPVDKIDDEMLKININTYNDV